MQLPPTTETKPDTVTYSASPQELLMQIRDALQQMVPSGQAEDYQNVFERAIGSGSGEIQLTPDGQVGYIYIPACSRDITLWAGFGRSRLLGRWSEGANINLQVPKVQYLEVQYGAGAAAESLTIWVSSRPIVVSDSGNGGRGVATAAPVSSVTVTVASTPIVPASLYRRVALIQNYTGSTVFLDTSGGTATTAGYPLAAGSEYRHESTTAVTGICAALTADIRISDQV